MYTTDVRLRRWTRQEYERMVDHGIFGPEDHIELLDGEIVEMSPEGSGHTTGVTLVWRVLDRAVQDRYLVRGPAPIALDDASEPEPDVCVVAGQPRDYKDFHPRQMLLAVEVSFSSLPYDRGRKLRAYARNGVPEYWILNLVDRRLEVRRQPRGHDFGEVALLTDGDTVRPLFAPDLAIDVADLLP